MKSHALTVIESRINGCKAIKKNTESSRSATLTQNHTDALGACIPDAIVDLVGSIPSHRPS